MTGPVGEPAAGGWRTARVEAVVAAVVLLAGAVIAVESWRLGAGWTDDGPGAGYFPFYIGLLLCASSGRILFEALRRIGRDRELFVDGASLKRVLQVLLPALVYVAAMHFGGLYLASALYIAGFMVWIGGYGWLKSVVIGVALCAAFFVMFEVWFKVPLYKGLLNPTGFLGY